MAMGAKTVKKILTQRRQAMIGSIAQVSKPNKLLKKAETYLRFG